MGGTWEREEMAIGREMENNRMEDGSIGFMLCVPASF